VLPDRVIVYTRNGDLKSLPKGATPLDFAYYVHEEVGHSCIGARVNGTMHKLDHVLQMGDRLEIITRQGAKPSLDWLYNGYARTRRAQDKIKRFFREKTDLVIPEVKDLGLTIVRKRMSASRVRDLSLEELAHRLKCRSLGEMLEGVGIGEISVTQLDETIGTYILEQFSKADNRPTAPAPVSRHEFDLLYRQANCCLPIPGDETVSYISQGRGFTLHHAQCRNVPTLDTERLRPFAWPTDPLNDDTRAKRLYLSRLYAWVVQPSRTILFITETATIETIPIESIRVRDAGERGSMLEILLKVPHKAQVDKLMRRLNASDDVLMVRRVNG
jgi:GTP pyrophosphokinase